MLFFSGNNTRHTGQSHVLATSKGIENSSCDRPETTKNIALKNDDLNPTSRKSTEFRTPMENQNKQQRALPCLPSVRTPLAASTPAMVPPRKSCTPSVTTPTENRTHGPRDFGDMAGQQDNYSVIPEGDILILILKNSFSLSSQKSEPWLCLNLHVTPDREHRQEEY